MSFEHHYMTIKYNKIKRKLQKCIVGTRLATPSLTLEQWFPAPGVEELIRAVYTLSDWINTVVPPPQIR